MLIFPEHTNTPGGDHKEDRSSKGLPPARSTPSDDPPPPWTESPQSHVDLDTIPYVPQATTSSNPLFPENSYDVNEAEALDRAARSLEMAASLQSDPKVKKSLQKNAKKLRRNIEKSRSAPPAKRCLASCNPNARAMRNIGGNLLLLCTAPIHVTGAIVEGTGNLLDASGMRVKGLGMCLKKVHTSTVDRLRQ